MSRPKGRPPTDTDPVALIALQGALLKQAAEAGVPVAPETSERLAKALAKFSPADLTALEVVASSPLALEALVRLAEDNPEAFLRQYANLAEFNRPRLARVEHKGDGLGLGVFVAVEQREAGPPPHLAGKVVSEQ